MTGRWVSPVGRDRTRPVVSGGLLEVTGCWGPASGHNLTVEIGHSVFEAMDDVAAIR